jgi:hypothetical protein
MSAGFDLLELLVAGCAAALIAGAAGVYARTALRRPQLVATLLGGIAAVALARMALTRYSLFHANFHSTAILDAVYAAPWRSVRHYGVFHSLVYGSVMRLFGPDLRVVSRFNEVVAAITLALGALVARRWTGSGIAAACVVAVGALHPVLMRVAGSEEGHNLEAMLLFTAVAAIEAYREDPRPAALALLGGSLLAMLDTKQIGMAAFPLLLVLAHGRIVAGRRAVYGVFGVSALALLFPADTIRAEPGMFRLGLRLSPLFLTISALSHPLLDLRGAAWLVTPLVVVGVVWAARRMEAGRAALLLLFGLLASSFLLAEGLPVAFTFRLPALLMALVFAGIGLWCAIVRLTRAPERRPVVTGLVLAAVLLSPRALPGWSIVERASPTTEEYDFLRQLAPSLPAHATVVQYPWHDPSAHFPDHLLAGRGEAAEAEPPVLFFRGIGCSAFALHDPSFLQMSHLTFSGEVGTFPLALPDARGGAIRKECADLLADATPIGQGRTIATPSDWDSPFAIYSSPSFEVGMFQLAPAVVKELQRRSREPPVDRQP